jgi:putative ubiquitin-RnfH superfamily antitoxin RatB of RatAB toxin-antitoxin module
MGEPGANLIRIVVAYAGRAQAHLLEFRVPAGTTVGAAIAACGALSQIAELVGRAPDVGIFGRRCSLQDLVNDGDRIEIYRPLTIDPKLARRRRAALKAG